MFDPVNEPSFRLDVAGLPDAFEVLAFTGNEAISEPFVFEVDLLINDPTLDLACLLYRSAFLQFGAAGHGIHGQLHELIQREHGSSSRLCRVRLGPKLACLAQRFSQRICSAQSVPQILGQVLKEHGIAGKDWRLALSGEYPSRGVCAQHCESDLQFFQRLCAEEGLHYHFEHSSDGHCLIVGDRQGASCRGQTLVFQDDSELAARCRLEVQVSAQTAPVARGRTDLTTLRSGQLMLLCAHPLREWSHLWRLIRVEHQGGQDPLLPYSNTICAVPWGAPWMASPEVVRLIEGDPDQPRITGLLKSQSAVDRVEVPQRNPTRVPPAPDGLLALLQSSEPLVLLCLLHGGASFSHCRETVCTCRAATQSGQGGAL
jgi:type VI secretion system secreted protein VgrG